MNKVILIGRATKDFELRYTPNGTAVANGTIAVDRPYQKDKEKEADFINLVAWRQTAETAANYIRKGHKFGLEGSLQVRSYEKDGQKRYVTEVLVERVEFLESKNANHTSNNSSENANQSRNSDPFSDSKPIDISDDDLPF